MAHYMVEGTDKTGRRRHGKVVAATEDDAITYARAKGLNRPMVVPEFEPVREPVLEEVRKHRAEVEKTLRYISINCFSIGILFSLMCLANNPSPALIVAIGCFFLWSIFVFAKWMMR